MVELEAQAGLLFESRLFLQVSGKMDHAGQTQATDHESVPQRVDLLVVGAGFGGMYTPST